MKIIKDPIHPILEKPHTFRIKEFHYVIDCDDPRQTYIQMKLEKKGLVRTLRFYEPRDLEIEKGFPMPTHGMEILDVRNRQMQGIGIRVHDFDSNYGSVTFWARNVVDMDLR